MNEDDAPFIQSLFNDPLVVELVGSRGLETLDACRNYLLNNVMESYKNNGYGVCKIVLKETMKPIGTTAFVKRPWMERESEINIGYLMLDGYRGRGIVYEAAQACLDKVKDDPKFEDIVGTSRTNNGPSIAILKKLGLTFKKHYYQYNIQHSYFVLNPKYL
ncbi:hypothetical protein SAMD00019534_053260 [Acytostelium subglobosum LB1]|uniref:hypothetical protein n=1 Tax=Acytostelium subglobosum LB1 TaxID=1410327 RepID=UPI0006448863|nr:hypothetical protein SAMD00019534_053260 [Acytostelium subglobosum LB1]GAM22151.1 hypothetical protein SAMD00019534_053260 [Acytostelium subglobosum LB1]|eukprot:XP_012755251.1 hypothetical protein SAMD00019534_053260 [Acytostelium subglobosum LB1]